MPLLKNFVLYAIGKDIEHKPTIIKFFMYDVRGVDHATQLVRENTHKKSILSSYRLDPLTCDFTLFAIGPDGKTLKHDVKAEQQFLTDNPTSKETWYGPEY